MWRMVRKRLRLEAYELSIIHHLLVYSYALKNCFLIVTLSRVGAVVSEFVIGKENATVKKCWTNDKTRDLQWKTILSDIIEDYLILKWIFKTLQAWKWTGLIWLLHSLFANYFARSKRPSGSKIDVTFLDHLRVFFMLFVISRRNVSGCEVIS
jgi:hypothetical protein